MKLRRYVYQLFLCILTFVMLGAVPLSADNAGLQLQPTECKLSDFTEGEISGMAKEARKLVVDSYNSLARVINRIQSEYESESGSCHFLYGSLSKAAGEVFTGKLDFSDEVVEGAKKVDEIMHVGGDKSTYSLVQQITGNEDVTTTGGRKVDLREYTDWNVKELRQRAYASNNELNKIAEWAKSAKKGQAMVVTNGSLSEDDGRNLICERVTCKKDVFANDCDVVVKGDGDSFFCVDGGVGSTSFLQCNDKNANNYINAGGVGYCVNPKDRDIAYTFNSVDDFQNKVQDEKTQKCLASLEEIGSYRDKFKEARTKAIGLLAMFSGEVEDCQCTRGTDGVPKVDCPEDSSDEDDVDEDMCRSVADYENELSGKCFSCNLFANILGAVQKVSHNAFDATSTALIELLAIGFLLYVGYRTLLTIGSPEAVQLSKYLTDLLLQGAKVAITVLILMNPSFLYNRVLSPILISSVDFGMSITGVNSEKAMETGKKYAQNFDESNEYFSARTAEIMVGGVENFSNGATTMPAIGSALICHSFQNLPIEHLKVIPRISMFAEGVMLYVAGLIIWLAIGFYMLDCAVELGIVCALMAFFVACWPFKLTNGYTKIGWNMFLNVFFNFVMMGIVIATIIGLSVQALSVGTTKDELLSMVNADDVAGLEAKLQLGGLQTLVVLVCCAICMKLPAEAGRLANKFASGAQISDGPGGMGGALSGEAAQLGTNVAVGNFGKDHKLGGAAGLALKGIKAEAKSVGEHTGLTNALAAGGNSIKKALGAGKKQGQITNGFKKD